MKKKADMVLRSDRIFTGSAADGVKDGFVAVCENRILAVDEWNAHTDYLDEHTQIYDLRGKTVTPGFVDNHVFFMGYMWQHLGTDASGVTDEKSLKELLTAYETQLAPDEPLFGHDLDDELELDGNLLETWFPGRAAIVFRESREGCLMNWEARERYGFDEENCYAEACWRLFRELVGDREQAKEEYLEFQDMLASRGITGIKEIGFDDYYGFTDVLKELEDSGRLKHRVYLVSQPVGSDVDTLYGRQMQEKFQKDCVKFMGYNIMVDGDIESGEGDILDGYPESEDLLPYTPPCYEALKESVKKADKCGFRCALHAEGDRAVRKTLDIFEECQKENGKRDARHAVIDMELVDPADIRRMKENNITAINYVQIMSCYPEYKNYYGLRYFSEERQKCIWPYRSLTDAGVNLCWGTDLPLDVPDIPLSVCYAAERRFPDSMPEQGYNMQEAITPAEVLEGWTKNGQKANFAETVLGTLEPGKLADIAVIDGDIFGEKGEARRKLSVCMTIFDGKVVYDRQE